jgi:KDO2-lipid IV(A) lauroyltransferase
LVRSSWSSTLSIGRGLGALTWRFSRRNRERALTHLEIAFPEKSEDERRQLGRACFLHQGMNLTEYLRFSRQDLQRAAAHIDIEGWEHLSTAQKNSRPVLIVSGHCGNWELLGPACASRGVELWAIVRALEESWIDRLASQIRRRLGSRVIQRGHPDSPRQLLRVLRGGGNLVVFIDQDIRAKGAWVPFFSRLAHTSLGPAQMALKHSMTVIPAFCERLEDGHHLARFLAPLSLPADETVATALMTRVVEEQIRHRPEQWVWMHRRWRRRPPGGEGLGA